MPELRVGLMIWNSSTFKCSPFAQNEPKSVAALTYDPHVATAEVGNKLKEGRQFWLGSHVTILSRRDPYKRANQIVCRKTFSPDKQRRSCLSQVGFTWQTGQRELQFQYLCGVRAYISQSKGKFSRPCRFQSQSPKCGAKFGAEHLLTKIQGMQEANAVRTSVEGSLMRFSGLRKDFDSKFSLRAVTDDREALRDEGKEVHEPEGKKDQSYSTEKTKEKTVLRGGQRLGSYATTTAIAIQDSLPPEGFVVLMSCAVGLLTGVCVVLFNLGVHEIHDIVWKDIPNIGAAWLRTQPRETTWQQIILIPAGGGVVVGILNTLRTALEESNEDNSLWRYSKGFVRQLLKTGAAAITLGTGSSLGPEGPSVEIGASIATGVTTVLRNSRERKLSLVAAGSAAGISSGFNAAVAGCFFAVESVLPGLSSADSEPSLTTAMVLLSSVLASVVSQAGLGADPAFRIPAYDFRSPTELPLYLLLGVLCGGVSVALAKGSAYATTMFELLQKATSLPDGFLPPLGGLCVGIIALAYPEVLYWGFENVDVLLESHLPWIQGPPAILLLQLVGAKLVATSLCRGSGLVGGVYAPSLFIGAALGSAYGSLASYASTHADPKWHLDVLQVAAPQAYALVGMAATLAGVCQVPLTSVLLLFELTRDYRIILPLMGAVGLSSWVASTVQKKKAQKFVKMEASLTSVDGVSKTRFWGGPGFQNLDTVLIPNPAKPSAAAGLVIRGGVSGEKDLCSLEDTLCLTNLEVSEDRLTGEILVISAMRTRYLALPGETSLSEAMSKALAEKEWCVLILNQDKHLAGLLTLSDIQLEAEKAKSTGLVQELWKKPISALCRSVSSSGEIQVVTVFPDMTLKAAQRLMAGRGLRQIPVVADSKDTQGRGSGQLILGILDREGIKLACRAEATRRLLGFCGNGQSGPDDTNVSS
ncbi:unnamed protein product [Calypogeia fissa]